MKTTTPCTKTAIPELLSEFWIPHLVACEDLFKHLEYVDQSLKDVRVKALKQNLQDFDDLLFSQVPDGWRLKEYRRRTIITLAGKITYLRRICTEPSGICHAYLDEVLGIRTRRQLAPDAFLWIAETAANLSFRKTAKAFYERTGAKISHWLVMSVVREEGAPILAELYDELTGKAAGTPSGRLRISQEALHVEFDGIHVPLQKPTHEPIKPRWEYERDRQRHSFELKSAVAYAGKDDKRRRAGVVHLALDEQPLYFWPLLAARIAQDYDPEDAYTLHASSDLAGWCKNHDLDKGFPQAEIIHYADPYHVNREVRRAFGGNTRSASHIISLVYARKTKRLIAEICRVIAHAKKGKERSRYVKLLDYLQANIEMIKRGIRNNMGTMEGTNAHVYAARMKVWGGAWSRPGGQAMALIRSRLASGKPLIAPKPDNVLLSDGQIRRRQRFEESLLRQGWFVKETEGHGYEPPRGSIVLTTHMDPDLYGLLYYP